MQDEFKKDIRMYLLLAVKTLASVVFILWFLTTLRTIRMGRGLHRSLALRRATDEDAHRIAATHTFFLTLAMIIAADALHFLSTGRVIGGESGVVFWIHLPFALLFLCSIWIMRFWYSGNTHPVAHRIWAKAAFISFVVVAITGPLLIYSA